MTACMLLHTHVFALKKSYIIQITHTITNKLKRRTNFALARCVRSIIVLNKKAGSTLYNQPINCKPQISKKYTRGMATERLSVTLKVSVLVF